MRKKLLVILALACTVMFALAPPTLATEIPILGHGRVDVEKYHAPYKCLDTVFKSDKQPWWGDSRVAAAAAQFWHAITGGTNVLFCYDFNQSGDVNCMSVTAQGSRSTAHDLTENIEKVNDYAFHYAH